VPDEGDFKKMKPILASYANEYSKNSTLQMVPELT